MINAVDDDNQNSINTYNLSINGQMNYINVTPFILDVEPNQQIDLTFIKEGYYDLNHTINLGYEPVNYTAELEPIPDTAGSVVVNVDIDLEPINKTLGQGLVVLLWLFLLGIGAYTENKTIVLISSIFGVVMSINYVIEQTNALFFAFFGLVNGYIAFMAVKFKE